MPLRIALLIACMLLGMQAIRFPQNAHGQHLLHGGGTGDQAGASKASETFAILPIDTLFYVENRGLDRIVVDVVSTGISFKVTVDEDEVARGANTFLMPRLGEMTIHIGAALLPDQDSQVRVEAFGPEEARANVIFADLLFTPEVAYALEAAPLPARARLEAPYPNPTRGRVHIPYVVPSELASGIQVELAVYDLLGRRVETLERGVRYGGTFEAEWDGLSTAGAPVPSGVYFVRLSTDEATSTQRVVLSR